MYLDPAIPGGLASRTHVEQTSTARNERFVQVQVTPEHRGFSYTGDCSKYARLTAGALTGGPHS